MKNKITSKEKFERSLDRWGVFLKTIMIILLAYGLILVFVVGTIPIWMSIILLIVTHNLAYLWILVALPLTSAIGITCGALIIFAYTDFKEDLERDIRISKILGE